LLLRRTLRQFGIAPERVRLVWASAAEGVKLAETITAMVEEIRAMGPLRRPILPVPSPAATAPGEVPAEPSFAEVTR
jgi:hypothetical protein